MWEKYYVSRRKTLKAGVFHPDWNARFSGQMGVSMNYSELTFTNNFVFCKVLENNLDLCRQLLELILKVKIKKVVLVDKEKTLDITPDGKSVRLDIYVADDVGTVYNIEMQVSTKRNLPKRSRYYQGMIDLNLIEKGASYNSLKKSFVIFICMFDPFEKDLPLYTFTNRCKEFPELELGDETIKVFVNPYGNTEELSVDSKAFFEYLKEGLTQNDFTKRLDTEVEKVKENKEWRREYMVWISELEESKAEAREEGREEGRAEGREEGRAEGREEGRAEGRAEGREEGRAEGREEGRAEGKAEGKAEGREEGKAEGKEETAIAMLKDNLSIDKVIIYSGLSEKRVIELQKNLKNHIV